MKINTTTGKFIRCGATIEFEEISFRAKSLDKVMETSNDFMTSKYGDKFISFEHNKDFCNGWDYIARLKTGLDNDTLLSTHGLIGSTGKQWTALLRYEHETNYRANAF